MKTKKYIIITALGLSVLTPMACRKGFLNEKDTTHISESSLFQNSQDGVNLVTAIYDSFQHDRDYLLKALFYNANFLSQDFYNWGADVSYNNYQFPTAFDSGNVFWKDSYQAIARANAAIPIIAKMKANGVLTPALADRLTGECYFLRGAFYYYLGVTFGGVPLELKVVTDNGLHPRNSQDEVFASVASDMTTAAGLLPWPQDLPTADLGRATKGAALGYLGSALMWQKKYSEAVTAFKQLQGHYTLMPNYIDIHEYDHQNNQESLFEVQFDSPASGLSDWNAGNEQSWMTSFGMPEEITGFGYDYANPLLYKSFENGDTRKLATVIGPGDTHPSPKIQIKNYAKVISGFASTDPAVKATYTGADGKIINTCGTAARPWLGISAPPRSGFYGTKFWRDPNVTGNSNNPTDNTSHIFGDQNVILLRYGEILLSLAEAQFKSGDQAGALASVQQVRDRAWGKLTNAAVVVPSSTFGPDMMNIIINEYRHELGDETSLWFCLRRSGLQIQYIKDKFGITIPAGHDILPIPSQQIALNPTLTQNPNY